MYEWFKVEGISAAAMAEHKIVDLTLNDKYIGLLKKDNVVYAFAGTCPHSGAKFCDGWLDLQGRVVCPLHKYRFDPANGRNTSGEGYKLITYKVDIREDSIFIGMIKQATNL